MLVICNKASGCDSSTCLHKKEHEYEKECKKEYCFRAQISGIQKVKCISANITKEGNKVNMNEKKIGYKVVFKDTDSKLVSASVGSGKVTYALDINVKPRMWGGPLTGFSSKYRAIGFIATLSDEKRDKCEVYKMEYEPTEALSVWRLKNLMVDSKPLSELPEGTILAKNITLKEKIFG